MTGRVFLWIWKALRRASMNAEYCASATRDRGARLPDVIAQVLGVFLIFAFSFSSGGCALRTAPPEPQDEIGIYDPSLSADGKLLLFSVSINRRMYRLGQLNLETEELTMFFDLSIERSWRTPVFSPDGTTILAQSYCNPEFDEGCEGAVAGPQIVLIDVATHDVRLVTEGSSIHHSAAFSSDGRYLTFFAARTKDGLKQIDFSSAFRLSLDNMEREALFPTKTLLAQFYSPYPLMEVAPDDYLFSAVGPVNDQRLIDYAESLTFHRTGKLRGVNESVAYSFQLGGDLKPLPENINYRIAQLTVSSSGERKIFIDLSRTHPFDDDNYFNWELFSIEDDDVRQITDIQALIHHPFVSRDGSRVVFLADHTKKQRWDVWMMDMPDGKPRSTRLREILTEDVKAEHQKALEDLNQ
jgi:hypothetical protein